MISKASLNGKTMMLFVFLTAFLLLGSSYGACLSTKEESIPEFQKGETAGTNITSSGIALDFNHSGLWMKKEPNVAPLPRSNPAMAYDTIDGIGVLFGGWDYQISLNDTWEYNVSENNWTQIKPSNSPPGRSGSSMVYDSIANAFVLFGGIGDIIPDLLNDTWVFYMSNKSWIQKYPSISPTARHHHQMAYDRANDLIILFSGLPTTNDTWTYNLTNNTWNILKSNNSPAGRWDSDMTYDERDGSVMMFGGKYINHSASGETWSYNYTTNSWTEESPSPSPSARWSCGLVYDKKEDFIILFGGYDQNTIPFNDTWIYYVNNNSWVELIPFISPSPRGLIGMIYDDQNDAAVVFGGVGFPIPLNETWIFKTIFYNGNGTFTSFPYDTSGKAYFGTIGWNESNTTNTSILFQFRTANTSKDMDSIAFCGPDSTSASYYNSSGRQINAAHNGSRWLQYKAFLSTTNPLETPLLHNVTIRYNLIQNVSLIFPSGGENLTALQNITWSASDKDNDSLAFDIHLENESASVLLAGNLSTDSRQWPWNTDFTPNGTYIIRITAHDDNPSIPLSVNASSANFTIRHPAPPPPNHLPHVILVYPANNSYFTTTSIHLQWRGTDPDGDSLTYTVRHSDQPLSNGSVILNTTVTQSFDLTGLADNKTYYWTVDASDGRSNGTDIPTEIRIFTIRLPPANIPVRINSTPTTEAWVGKEYTYNLTTIDEDGDIPLFSIVTAPAAMTLDPSTGKLRWTPSSSDIGNHTISVRVADGRGSTDNQTFTITVKDVPTPPVVPPKCAITYPASGTTVKGTIQVHGTASNGSLPLSAIKIRLDNGTWTTAVGLENWTFTLNTAKLAKGPHHIDAKAFASNFSSDPASAIFSVSNPGPAVTTGGDQWCLAGAAMFLIAAIAALILLRRQRSR